MNIAFIGIGSNLGDRRENCFDAISLLENLSIAKILKKSSLYHTPPYGFETQAWFVNAAVKIETPLPIYELFLSLKSIEKKLGRKAGFRWGPRIIDLDLLFYNSVVFKSVDLIVPHPEIQKRKFVLEPLAEIDKEWIHPLFSKDISKLLEDLGTLNEEVLAA